MRLLFMFIFLAAACLPISAPFAEGDPLATPQPAAQKTAEPQLEDKASQAYLAQARAFKNDGRYELARQSCAFALSTCKNMANLEIIKRELDEIELLIRSMR